MNVGKRSPVALEMKRDKAGNGFLPVEPDGDRTAYNRDMVILVHGFNNDRESAQQVYDNFLAHYRRGGVPERYLRRIVPFFWPAYRDWWPRAASYSVMIGDTIAAAAVLRNFLSLHFREYPRAQVTFVAHSLGCRLVLEALAGLISSNNEGRRQIRHSCLLAAAVPVNAFALPAGQLAGLLGSTLSFSGIASKGDLTLATLFRFGGWLSVDGTASPAVGYAGLPDALWTEPCEHLKIGHKQYWANSRVAEKVAGKIGIPVARNFAVNGFFTTERAVNRLSSRKIGQ